MAAPTPLPRSQPEKTNAARKPKLTEAVVTNRAVNNFRRNAGKSSATTLPHLLGATPVESRAVGTGSPLSQSTPQRVGSIKKKRASPYGTLSEQDLYPEKRTGVSRSLSTPTKAARARILAVALRRDEVESEKEEDLWKAGRLEKPSAASKDRISAIIQEQQAEEEAERARKDARRGVNAQEEEEEYYESYYSDGSQEEDSELDVSSEGEGDRAGSRVNDAGEKSSAENVTASTGPRRRGGDRSTNVNGNAKARPSDKPTSTSQERSTGPPEEIPPLVKKSPSSERAKGSEAGKSRGSSGQDSVPGEGQVSFARTEQVLGPSGASKQSASSSHQDGPVKSPGSQRRKGGESSGSLPRNGETGKSPGSQRRNDGESVKSPGSQRRKGDDETVKSPGVERRTDGEAGNSPGSHRHKGEKKRRKKVRQITKVTKDTEGGDGDTGDTDPAKPTAKSTLKGKKGKADKEATGDDKDDRDTTTKPDDEDGKDGKDGKEVTTSDDPKGSPTSKESAKPSTNDDADTRTDDESAESEGPTEEELWEQKLETRATALSSLKQLQADARAVEATEAGKTHQKKKSAKVAAYGWGRLVEPFFSENSTKDVMAPIDDPNQLQTETTAERRKRARTNTISAYTTQKTKKKKKVVFDENHPMFAQANAYPTQRVPTKMDPAWLNNEEIKSVSMIPYSTLFLTASGKVYAIGYYQAGTTNPAENPFLDRPTLVAALADRKVLSIKHCSTHTIAICKGELGGQCVTWGDNDEGQLGHGDSHPHKTPKTVASFKELELTMCDCGPSFSVVVSKDHKVWTCGSDANKQLGHEIKESKGFRGRSQTRAKKKDEPVTVNTFKEVFGLKGKIAALSVGHNHLAILTFNGDLFTLGSGKYGVLGHGCPDGVFVEEEVEASDGESTHSDDEADVKVDDAADQREEKKEASQETDGVTASTEKVDGEKAKSQPDKEKDSDQGKDNDEVMAEDGKEDKESEESDKKKKMKTIQRLLTAEEQVERMAARTAARVIVKREIATDTGETKTVVEKFRSVTSGAYHIIALTASGNIYAWGRAESGQLGLPDCDDIVPEPVAMPPIFPGATLNDIASIGCGVAHSAIATAEGDIFIFGRDGDAMGLYRKHDIKTPVRHEYLRSGCTSIYCGLDATIALCVTKRVRTVPAFRTAAVLRSHMPGYIDALKVLFSTFVDPLRSAAKLSMPIIPRNEIIMLFRNFDDMVLNAAPMREDIDDLLQTWIDKGEDRLFIRWLFSDIRDVFEPYITGAELAHEDGLKEAWVHKFAVFVQEEQRSTSIELEELMAVPLRMFVVLHQFFTELVSDMDEAEPAYLVRSESKAAISRSQSMVSLCGQVPLSRAGKGKAGPPSQADLDDFSPEVSPYIPRAAATLNPNTARANQLSPSPSTAYGEADTDTWLGSGTVSPGNPLIANNDIPPYTISELKGEMDTLQEQAQAILTKLDGDEDRAQKKTSEDPWILREVLDPVLKFFGFRAFENDYKRRAYLVSSVFLWAPFLVILIAGASGRAGYRYTSVVCLTLFFGFAFLIVIKSVWHGRKDPELVEISNPATRVRPNIQNGNEFVNMVVELFQLTSFAVNRSMPWNNDGGQTSTFEFFTFPRTSDTFPAVVVLFILGVIVWMVVQKIFRKGEDRFPKLYRIYSFVLPAFFTGPLYMVLLGSAFSFLDCSYSSDAPATLDVNPSTDCWTGVHLFHALLGLIGFGLYFPIATLTPYHAHSEFLSPKRDIRYVPLYMICVQISKAFLTLMSTFFETKSFITIPLIFLVNLALLLSTIAVRPSCIPLVNWLRCGVYTMVCWSAVAALATVIIDEPSSLIPTILLFVGWLIIIAVLLVLRRYKSLARREVGAAQHAFSLEEASEIVPSAGDEPPAKGGKADK